MNGGYDEAFKHKRKVANEIFCNIVLGSIREYNDRVVDATEATIVDAYVDTMSRLIPDAQRIFLH